MPHYLYTGNHRGLTPMEVMMDIFARQQAKPFFLVLIRLVVMAALALATYGVLRVTGISRDFPPTDTIYFPFVTIICGIVIWRTFRQYNVSFWAYLGFERHRIGKDIAWGLLWLVVTYIPLIITLMGAMYLMFGADMFNHFERLAANRSHAPLWRCGCHYYSGAAVWVAAHHVCYRRSGHGGLWIRVLCMGCYRRHHCA